jgi:peptidylamidoglycolate lyase
MLFKKFIFSLLILTGLLLTSYYLQPIKKGAGLDALTKYELVKDWPQLPPDLKLGNPTGIGIDTNQNIVIVHRADRKWPVLGSMPTSNIQSNTILIFDKDNGELIDTWGNNLFIMPHGLTVDNENNIWVTDVGLHQIFKFSHNGKLLMKLGGANVSGNDSLHFNKPTDIDVTQSGSFYVSDGYGNSRIVKFSATGKYLFEWGKKGSKEGEFDIPHGIDLDDEGNVYIADRENNRVQTFDSSGRFLKQWTDNSFGNICSISIGKEKSKLFAIDDFTFLKLKHRGSDILIFDTLGKVQTRFGRSGTYKGSGSWYHDLTIDKDENIYIGDILYNRIQKFKKISIK